MSGLTYLEVTQLLKVNRTTIWRRRMKLQKKNIYYQQMSINKCIEKKQLQL